MATSKQPRAGTHLHKLHRVLIIKWGHDLIGSFQKEIRTGHLLFYRAQLFSQSLVDLILSS